MDTNGNGSFKSAAYKALEKCPELALLAWLSWFSITSLKEISNRTLDVVQQNTQVTVELAAQVQHNGDVLERALERRTGG